MPDKDQWGIFNKEELSLIKNTFADNDALLYTLRKVFLQLPITETERGLLNVAITPEVYAVLKKRILPEIAPCFPLGQLPSILTTLTTDLKSKSLEDMALQFKAKKLENDYLEQQFEVLKGSSNEPIKLSDMASLDKSPEDTFVGMTAYLFLLGYIDPSLVMIKSLAGAKEETVAEQEKRLKRDSSQ